MADSTTDAFSAEDSDATTDGTTLSTSEEYKYAQLSVPNFSFDTTSSSTASTSETSGGTTTETNVTTTTTSSSADTNPSGNSFIRLGSFPYSTTTTTSTTSDTGLTVATSTDYPDAPTGFEDSLTLAKLVGDATALAAYTTDDLTTTDEHGVISSDPYNGDPNGLLGFADDTRVRDDADKDVLYIDKVAKTNTTANRRAETQRLLTKGGWWDHADGNRISTTAGDKIEVIQGNYKLVVLGRRDPSKATTKGDDAEDLDITDISGGYEFSKTYEYLEDEEMWAVHESSSAKRSYKKTAGVEVSDFTGTRWVKIIGKDPGQVIGEGKDNLQDGPDEQDDPVVIAKTWAKRTETYTGSANKPVPEVLAVAYVHMKNDIQIGSSNNAVKVLAGDNSSATVCALNISTTACVWDLTVKAAALSYNFTFAGQVMKWEFGYSTSIHKFTDQYAWQETKAAVGQLIVTYADATMTNIRTGIANTLTNISNAFTSLSNSNAQVSHTNVFVADLTNIL